MNELLASGADDDAMVRFIRANQSCLSQVDKDHNSILQMVILKSHHNIKTIACLLELCPSLITCCNKRSDTALHTAVRINNYDIVDQLIQAHPSAMYEPHRTLPLTPFQMAVAYDRLAIVKRMMTIDPKAIDRSCDMFDGVSLLHAATDPDMVVYLLTCKPALIDKTDDCGNTPLHLHLLLGRKNMSPKYARTVDILLQRKPSLLYARNDKGELALDLANRRQYGNVVESYLRFDPYLQYYYNGHDKYHNTVLHLLACNAINDTNLIVMLISINKHQLLLRNIVRRTPLDSAICHKNEHVANQFRLHCSLDETIASYHKYSPDTNIDTWALEQCSMLNTFLLPELARLTLTFLGTIYLTQT